MDRLINITVKGTHLSKDSNRAGVRGEANVTRLRISFDDGWKGFAKKVTFWDALGKNPVTIPLTADMLEDIASSTCTYLCPIPGEALTEGGTLTFIVDGYTDGKRQRSVSDELEVVPAPMTEGSGDAQDPTPSEAERLQAQIDGILDVIANEVTGASQHAANAAASAENASAYAGNSLSHAESAAEYARWAKDSADDALVSENAAAGHAAAAQAWSQEAKDAASAAFPDGILSLADLNAAPQGVYACRDCANGPAGNTVGLLICKAYDGNYVWQLYHSYAHKKSFQRYCDGAVWAAWEEIYTSRNITELRDALKEIW